MNSPNEQQAVALIEEAEVLGTHVCSHFKLVSRHPTCGRQRGIYRSPHRSNQTDLYNVRQSELSACLTGAGKDSTRKNNNVTITMTFT